MAINPSPPPAAHLVLELHGRGTVLEVTTRTNLDGETLAVRVYEAYVHRVGDGEELPQDITADTVMKLLAEEHANCTEGWHRWVNQPTRLAWKITWPWAQEQSRRLFPGLTWNLEGESRRLDWPWDGTE